MHSYRDKAVLLEGVLDELHWNPSTNTYCDYTLGKKGELRAAASVRQSPSTHILTILPHRSLLTIWLRYI
jgi:hypothetical protein